MINFRMLFLILITGLVASCEKTEIQNEDANKILCEKQIIIDENLFQSAANDSLTIKNAMVVNDEIQVSVEYVGGCGEQTYQLLTHGRYAESIPVQLQVLLSFENNDSCNAVIQEDICFDLKELSTHYEQSYQDSEGTIIIRLQEYENELSYTF